MTHFKFGGSTLLLAALATSACGGEDNGDTVGTVGQEYSLFNNTYHIALKTNGPNVGGASQMFQATRTSLTNSWSNYTELPMPVDPSFPNGFSVGSARTQGVGFDTHIMVNSSGSPSHLWHRIRTVTGGFVGGWGLASASNALAKPDALGVRDFCLAEVGTTGGTPGNRNNLHVMYAGGDGHLYHGIRFTSDGHWQAGIDTQPYAATPSNVLNVACAGDNLTPPNSDTNLHIVIVAGNTLYHTMRVSNGNWAHFAPIPKQSQFGGIVTSFGVAATVDSQGNLNVFAITPNHRLWHNKRINTDNGPWDDWTPAPSFPEVWSVSAGILTSGSGAPDSSQVLVSDKTDPFYIVRGSGSGPNEWGGTFTNMRSLTRGSLPGLPAVFPRVSATSTQAFQ